MNWIISAFLQANVHVIFKALLAHTDGTPTLLCIPWLGIQREEKSNDNTDLQIESKLCAKSYVADSIRGLAHALWASTQNHLWLPKANLLQTHKSNRLFVFRRQDQSYILFSSSHSSAILFTYPREYILTQQLQDMTPISGCNKRLKYISTTDSYRHHESRLYVTFALDCTVGAGKMDSECTTL